MKKIILLGILLFCASITNAQISKGTILSGGSISANKSKTEYPQYEAKAHGFSFYPSVGITVKNNLVFGIRGGYQNDKIKYIVSNFETSTKGYLGGLFLRKYMSLGKAFYLFGETGATYFYIKQDETATAQRITKIHGFDLYLYPGIAYAVNKRIHLELSLNDLVSLSYTKNTTDNIAGGISQVHTESKGFSFGTNFSTSSPLSVGFRFVLGK